MNKHTAGKWEYDTSGNHYHAYMSGVIRMNGVLIAKMVTQTTHKLGEVEANARLIVAAPDLLEACTAVDTFFVFFDSIVPPGGDFGSGAREALRLAHVAIAKAKGGEARKNIRYCRNHYGGKTEYCLLIEKRTGRNILGLVIAAVLATVGLFVYFWN